MAEPAREKVILDTDFTTSGDDGMVGIMAAQLHAQGVIELLGITVVAGNEWLPQEVADALQGRRTAGDRRAWASMQAPDTRWSTTTGISSRRRRCGVSAAPGTGARSRPTAT